MSSEDVAACVAARNRAVWNFSPAQFRKYVQDYCPEYLPTISRYTRKELKVMMAKLCYQITNTPPAVMETAERILTGAEMREQNDKRRTGDEQKSD